MTDITAEQVTGSHTLYDLAADMRLEAKLWKARAVRRVLEHGAAQIEAAARMSLHESPAYADGWIEAGSRYLDAHVCHRRFIEALGPLSQRGRRSLITLDCRGGAHAACPVCDCQCHRRAV